MAGQNPNTDLFDAYFRRADLDQDGKISGPEAVAFFQGSNLSKQVLAEVWKHADKRCVGWLDRHEFYNALKLVTVAQAKRQLTPETVKAALYSPASAQIPAPQINVAATPAPRVAVPDSQMRSITPSPSISGVRPPTSGFISTSQQYFPSQQNQFMRPPQALPSGSATHPQLSNKSMPRGENLADLRPPNNNVLADWLGGGTTAPTTQVPNSTIRPSTTRDEFGLQTNSILPIPQISSEHKSITESKPHDSAMTFNHIAAKESKTVVASANGIATDSYFGDVFSASPAQQKQNSPASVLANTSSQSSAKSSSFESVQSAFSQPPVRSHSMQGQPDEKQRQQFIAGTAPSTPTGSSAGAQNLTDNPPQLQWPRMNQADIQKYTEVFLQVDTDKDGKITGEQARNLFLSWRIPREVLMKIWDLSDQDNDSMLSLKEFCVSLYLMERFREGRPLPPVLPSSIMLDEALMRAIDQPSVSYGTAALGPGPGIPQSHLARHARPPMPPATGRKPPRPSPSLQNDLITQPRQQKPKVPVLEKQHVDQLSKDEQDALNSKFQEASAADKKVEELEKEISDSRQKIEFFRAKMQELILHKSRCDNRANEIMERISADKREADSLAKKYEEKYRQAGDVASKLTLEEATFNDIQERKMDVYRAILKLEEGGTANGAVKDRADHIQSNLEELVKALNEQCKQYGLRAKPISLVELPFGWQPGIQDDAADWDESWDMFEDEGFTYVKELTRDVQNIVAPPKTKTKLVGKEKSSTNVASNDLPANTGEQISREESPNGPTENGTSGSPPESPDRKSTVAGQSRHTDSNAKTSIGADGSPHARDTKSDDGVADTVASGEMNFDKANWSKFDADFDAESAWGIEATRIKDMEDERRRRSSMFDLDDFGLKPIRTEPSNSNARGKSSFLFADSVPSTPSIPSSIFADSVPSTPAKQYSIFADSVPSTPAKQYSIFADSVPSTPAKPYSIFADSVPGTPAYHFENTPRKFNEEDHSFKNFSRFDSFNTNETVDSHSPRNLARFDSMRSSTGDSEFGQGFPSMFDSFNARESDYSRDFSSRFDSFNYRDNTDEGQNSHGFQSRFDSFNGRESQDGGAFMSRFDSFRDSPNENGSSSVRDFPSFDDTDPFGSGGPFRTSETPRKSYNETPRKDSETTPNSLSKRLTILQEFRVSV